MSEQISQHLRVSSPSPTAVNYTVSSRARHPSTAVTLLKHMVRVFIVFYAVLATLVKLQITLFDEVHTYVQLCCEWTLVEQFVHLITDKLEWWMLLMSTAVTIYLCLRRDYIGQCTHLSLMRVD